MAQKIDVTREPAGTAAPADLGGPLHFEGAVDLGGSVSAQQLSVLFGPESQVNGKLRFDGSVQIDGTFRGAIKTNDALVIGANATVEADIHCGSATVSGSVIGNITATDSVTLGSGAHVKGDIAAPALSVEKGATFDGLSRMGTLKGKRAGR
jgi:cytoskeletal protein CcmA (bactofilin family)